MMICYTNSNISAQSLETLIMPGEVIRGHAELEAECSSCHVSFNRAGQSQLCLDCHEDVADDVTSRRGYHGRDDEVAANTCASCHTEHEGRNTNIVILDEQAFDHLLTDFELHGKHVDVDCEGCHAPGVKHRDTPDVCIDCHLEDDVHDGFLGESCADCHNPADWLEVEFDHATTGWSLLGKHVDAGCSDCHADQTHQNTPTTCFGCHAEDDFHQGRSGEQCENCHNPSSWNDTSFDHNSNTNFPLEFSHAALACDDCHSEDPFSDSMDMACVSCHLEDDTHDGHRGRDCESCHSTRSWETSSFDHNLATAFDLNGAHRDIACTDCHADPVFESSPGSDCVDCHKEDDPHQGHLGDNCSSCHTETDWLEVPYFEHDFTDFPLLGEHANIDCGACHETQKFADTSSQCVDCHQEDDNHDGIFESNCESCHNPVAWDLWIFDHNRQTNFELRGAHTGVACDSCHRTSLNSMRKTGNRCEDCHLSDDIHDGEFGPDCGRCHSDSSFKEVRSLQ